MRLKENQKIKNKSMKSLLNVFYSKKENLVNYSNDKLINYFNSIKNEINVTENFKNVDH